MSVAHKIAEVCTWGTPGAMTEGKIVSLEVKNTAKTVEVEDGNGELGSLVLHDGRKEMTAEVIAKAAAVRPAVGGTVTIAATTFFITESADKWTAGAVKKIAISGFAVLDL